jgi:hypothetical protein
VDEADEEKEAEAEGAGTKAKRIFWGIALSWGSFLAGPTDTRTKSSWGRHVVAVTWSATSPPGTGSAL